MGFKVRAANQRVVGTASVGPVSSLNIKVQSAFNTIGGFDKAKHLTIAAKAIYEQTVESDRSTVKTNSKIWPRGWKVVGDGWYGLSEQVTGNRTAGVLPNLETKHAVTVLEFHAGSCFEKGDILIACRGTDFGLKGMVEGKIDLAGMKADFKHPGTGKYVGKVHQGFYDIYNTVFLGKISGNLSLFEAVLKRKPKHIYVTGHSLGGAMSHLCALGLDLLAQHLNIPTKVRVCSFAAPRVCNCRIPPSNMYRAFKNSGLEGVRVVNLLDPVGFLPGASGAGSLVIGALSTAKASFKGNAKSAIKSFMIGTVGSGVASVAEVAVVLHGITTGIWDHPDFEEVTFADSGSASKSPHPHSMDLYKHLMLKQNARLDA